MSKSLQEIAKEIENGERKPRRIGIGRKTGDTDSNSTPTVAVTDGGNADNSEISGTSGSIGNPAIIGNVESVKDNRNDEQPINNTNNRIKIGFGNDKISSITVDRNGNGTTRRDTGRDSEPITGTIGRPKRIGFGGETEDEGFTTDNLVKRGPGRPRKNPNEVTETSRTTRRRKNQGSIELYEGAIELFFILLVLFRGKHWELSPNADLSPVSEPLERIVSRLSPETAEKVAKNSDYLMLIVGMFCLLQPGLQAEKEILSKNGKNPRQNTQPKPEPTGEKPQPSLTISNETEIYRSLTGFNEGFTGNNGFS